MSIWSRIFAPFRGKADKEQPGQEEPTEFQVVEEMLRSLQKRERRQAQTFERMLVELSTKIDNIQVQLSSGPPFEAVSKFAESFAIYYLRNHDRDESLKHIWSRFSVVLEEFGLELILDQGRPFDDTRHQACDIRQDLDHPDNTILEVVQPGLIIRGKIKRPAIVVTSKQNSGA